MGLDVLLRRGVIEGDKITPQPVKDVPEAHQLLMRSVKLYKRRAVDATLHRSREEAVYALMVHPLVLSYPLAETLVDEYLEAHASYIGEWS